MAVFFFLPFFWLASDLCPLLSRFNDTAFSSSSRMKMWLQCIPELQHASYIFGSGELHRSVKRWEVSARDRTVDTSKQGSVSSSSSQSERFPRPEPRGTWLEKWHGTTQSRIETCWVSFLSGKYRPVLPQCTLLSRKYRIQRGHKGVEANLYAFLPNISM